MTYNINDIDKILSFKTWSDKQKIDELLRIDSNLQTNMGVDSTKTERAEAKRKSRIIYKAIKKIDPIIGSSFLITD